MRKNLSGKTDWCKHTRNSARGKRGVNKLERRVPVPDEEQPACKPPRRKKKRSARNDGKYYAIEYYSFFGKKWMMWGKYRTREDRDNQLAKLNRSFFAQHVKGESYRAVDLPIPDPKITNK